MKKIKQCSHPDGCCRKVIAKNLCELHYTRLKIKGNIGSAQPERIYNRVFTKCTVDGCEKLESKWTKKGYCSMHSSRLKKKGEVGSHLPINFDPAPEGHKTCSSCLKIKIYQEFGTVTKRKNKTVRSICKECASREQRKRKYNLTNIQLEELFKDAKCQICLVTKNLVIDHCHKTNRVRGIICKKCNTSIGGLLDDWKLVKKAYEYLFNFEQIGDINEVI